jgi:hypothetical protein
MNVNRLSRDDLLVIGALVVFTVLFKLLTVQMIHTSFDERDYWMSAKRLLLALPYSDISHRTIRWAIILPVYLFQLLFGTNPATYYITPVLFSVISVVMAYRIGLLLANRAAGFLASLYTVGFPYMLVRAGTQVRPEIFSLAYVLLAAYFLIVFLRQGGERLRPLVFSAIILFVAYLSKITNLYFFPGFALGAYLAKRRWRDLLLFSGILIALFLVETGVYNLALGTRFGHLSVILENHLSGSNRSLEAMSFFGLLERWSFHSLRWYWQIAFISFVPAAVLVSARRRDPAVTSVVVMAVGFFLGITFAVKSINPFVPAEPFNTRYFTAVLGPVMLIHGLWTAKVWERTRAKLLGILRFFSSPLRYGLFLLAFLGFLLILLLTGTMPEMAKRYFTAPWHPDSHPLALTTEHYQRVNEAYAQGTAIVSSHDIAGLHALETTVQFFLRDEFLVDGVPKRQVFQYRGKEYQYVSAGPFDTARLADNPEVLVALRDPYRVVYAPFFNAQEMVQDHGTDPEQ